MARQTMHAIVQTRYGPPDVLQLEEVARPVPRDDEVLVRVRAASLHPDVWHVVSGQPYVVRLMGAGMLRPKRPIPGTDMAGVVESVGARVTRFRPGEEVFGETILTNQWINGGAFAEYVAVPEELLDHKPATVSFAQAACVPTAGYIALSNLRSARHVTPGQRALVNGAGGGVGSLALQILKARGAHVTAVDSPRKLDLLRQLGADEVIDYTQRDFTSERARYDLIFDIPGNHPIGACRQALTPNGKYVLIGHDRFGASGKKILGTIPHFFGFVVRSLLAKQLRQGRAGIPTRTEAMAMLRKLLDERHLTPVVDRTYPLAEAAQALRYMIEHETIGRVVLVL